VTVVSARSPITTGVVLATLAAVAFAVTTPAVAWAGRTAGPFTTAAVLYLGAAAAALLMRIVGGCADPKTPFARAIARELAARGSS
jgi:hypothetical protein